jgi:20S proteasome subunit beta 6
MRADIETLHKHMKIKLEMYKNQFGKEATLEGTSQMLSNTLYYRRFFPFYSFNLLCGLDSKGEGAVYGYDAIGSFDKMYYGSQGSGGQLVVPVLDNQLKGHNNLNDKPCEDYPHAFDFVRDSMNSCVERDIHTGTLQIPFLI